MKKGLILLLITLVLTGCTNTTKKEMTKDEMIKEKAPEEDFTNNNYTFFGESKHWKAQYVYTGRKVWQNNNGTDGLYVDKNHYSFALTYKGPLNELSSIKKLEYFFNVMDIGEGLSHEFWKPPTTRTFSASGEAGSEVSEDSIVKVNVKWENWEESFNLYITDE
ncbi:hypothetical protein [Priestia koreensis]|uniref:hypothetical protein n=1 Tax=Priestia koreensis TaxID=284581 RepID=UPI001F5604B7|nr:hypothetical protein [Priestia koreensis]MCM3006464.1 hypothetical protein [Priestia koreensis]UNL83635.1 hypothetical protein IE339_15870 [Priestia koreensis]